MAGPRKGAWSWPLLAAALSRSDTPQGNAVLDGRTEDLVGLGLISKLAQLPRGWLLEHQDGLRSAILVLDGVVADINFAIGIQNGPTISLSSSARHRRNANSTAASRPRFGRFSARAASRGLWVERWPRPAPWPLCIYPRLAQAKRWICAKRSSGEGDALASAARQIS